MPNTVVIADDITGANDIGIMYTKAGRSSVVYSCGKLEPDQEFEDDVSVIDTNSRFCTREEAYRRVYEAVKLFDKNKVHQFYDKQCSVFRGNIGAEFDAMLDALEEEFAIVVLGFPDNGRTTLHGIHYVHGVKLEDSQFKNDPVHPMRQSDLREILQAQTRRRVSAVHYEILDQGAEALRSVLLTLRSDANYVIIDVRNNHDLAVIAEAVKEEKIICGSSALGYYLGRLDKKQPAAQTAGTDQTAAHNHKILCIAGSLTPQTKAQVAYMKTRNCPVITLDTCRLFSAKEYGKEMSRILKEYETAYEANDLIVIHSMNEAEEVRRTKALAAQNNRSNTEASVMVSDALTRLAKQIGERYGIHRFIICGGDTSASFCNCMGITGMRLEKEIEAGLPLCRSITRPYDQLILKSGSFGTEEFLWKAKEALSEEGRA